MAGATHQDLRSPLRYRPTFLSQSHYIQYFMHTTFYSHVDFSSGEGNRRTWRKTLIIIITSFIEPSFEKHKTGYMYIICVITPGLYTCSYYICKIYIFSLVKRFRSFDHHQVQCWRSMVNEIKYLSDT